LVNDTLALDDAVSGRTVTLYVPAMQFDVQLTVATPSASVIANGLESVHDAPDAWVVKSTRTLGAGRPFAWNTVARIIAPLTVAWIDAFTGASTAP
jgi:hypothetical protein